VVLVGIYPGQPKTRANRYLERAHLNTVYLNSVTPKEKKIKETLSLTLLKESSNHHFQTVYWAVLVYPQGISKKNF